jgi:hypothetical protein
MSDFGEWGTVSFELPDFLEDTRESINSVAEFLLEFLDIALSALQLLKAFAVGSLDPIAALVQAIIDQVSTLLADLQNLGIYITGDWALLESPYQDLRGGYSEYERRMIARLTDKTDPTRPDISGNASVLGAFFYLSVDYSGISRLVQFVEQLLDLFNQSFNPSGTPPVPIVTGIQFGTQANGDVFDSFENLVRFEDTPPEKVKITWKVQPTNLTSPFNPFPPVGPQGFLVTVGTREEGIPLAFNRPENDAKKREPEGGDTARRSSREAGKVLDRKGQPYILYGGSDMLDGPLDEHSWNSVVEGPNQFRDGHTAVYGLKSRASGEVIDLDLLREGEDIDNPYLLQRTFAVDPGQISAWVKQEYSLVLNFDDLPHDAEFKVDNLTGQVTVRDLGRLSTYYVRIASTDNAEYTLATPLGDRTISKSYALDFSKVRDLGNNPGELFRIPQKGQAKRSAWSPAFKATIPNSNTGDFLDAVSIALMVLVLSRSDLPLIDEVEGWPEEAIELAKEHKKLIPGVALLATGLEPYKGLLEQMFPGGFKQFIETKGQNPQRFRQELLTRVRGFAKELCDKLGARPELHEFIAQNTLEMRNEASVQALLLGVGETGAIKEMRRISDLPSMNDASADFLLLAALSTELDTETLALKQRNNDLAASVDKPPEFPNLSTEPAPQLGAWRSIGFAPNPYSMEVPEALVGKLMSAGIPDVIRGRKGDFIEVTPADVADWEVKGQIPASSALQVLADSPPSLRMFYEKYLQADGSILVPTKVLSYMDALAAQERKVGSADLSPVFYFGADKMRAAAQTGVVPVNVQDAFGARYLRTMFREWEGGLLYSQSALVLGVAAAAGLRHPQDGEWIAIRFLDSFPALDGFFETLQQWLDALAESIKSVTDAIVQYIEFVEDRIVELQNLIRRLNSLIQSILGFTVGIPQCSGLLLVGQGTDDITRQFITADNKPSDSPLAYGGGKREQAERIAVEQAAALDPAVGAPVTQTMLDEARELAAYGGGVAVLAGGAPTFLIELLQVAMGQDSDPKQDASVTSPGPLFGLENLEAPNNPPPDDEPDVL